MHYLQMLMLPATVALLVVLVRQFPWLGWLTAAFFVVSAYDYSGYTQLANLGGIAIYPADVAAIVSVPRQSGQRTRPMSAFEITT